MKKHRGYRESREALDVPVSLDIHHTSPAQAGASIDIAEARTIAIYTSSGHEFRFYTNLEFHVCEVSKVVAAGADSGFIWPRSPREATAASGNKINTQYLVE